jgi:hypothetical protein
LCPCFESVLWCPSSLSLSIRSFGSVVTCCMPYNNSLFPRAVPLWQWCQLLLPASLMPCCVFVLAHMKFWMGAKEFMSSHRNVRQNFHVSTFSWWDSTSTFESGTKFFL